jgi:hypothetical protein
MHPRKRNLKRIVRNQTTPLRLLLPHDQLQSFGGMNGKFTAMTARTDVYYLRRVSTSDDGPSFGFDGEWNGRTSA